MRLARRLVGVFVISILLSISVASLAAEGRRSALELPFTWESEDGGKLALSSLLGKPVILTFSYTSCHMTCPLTVRKLKRVEAELARRSLSAEFVIVSMEPRIDTPRRMTRFYREGFGIHSPNWHFLRGDLESTHQLARELGFRFEDLDGHIVHDNKFLLFDRHGVLRKSITGWDTNDQEFLAE